MVNSGWPRNPLLRGRIGACQALNGCEAYYLGGLLLDQWRSWAEDGHKVSFGNHSSVLVPQQERDSIRKFYCDVVGGKNHESGSRKGLHSLGRRLL
jgi:hypothetical protein